MFVEINSVRSEEQSFQIFNWWYPDFQKFKEFDSNIQAKINLNDGSYYEGDILDYKMSISAFWSTGSISDKKYTNNSISFTWKGTTQNGDATIFVIVYFLNNGRSINVNYDIQSSYIYSENETKKVEIKTNKVISINGLNYYSVWSGGIGDTYDNPNFNEYGNDNPNLKDKLKIEKYEIQTIETDKKTSQQKITKSNYLNTEKVASLVVQIGNFKD